MLEIGEYVRDCDGFIVKVNDIVPDEDSTDIWYKEKTLKGTWKSMIVNHSKNIIDLIEIGDYVNGYRVLEKTKIKNNEMQICILKDNNCSNWRTVNDKTLKSIVTKEQFASMEYRAKEE